MSGRVLTPGRYALDRNGRLYSCRGPWRRNAVAIVTIRRRPDHLTERERNRLAEAEALLASPELAEDSNAATGAAARIIRAIHGPIGGSMRQSSARFKPMALRSEDDDAAAAYARAAEASSRD